MKSCYYDILDKYYGGFCGEGDSIAFEDENEQIINGKVKNCCITFVSVEIPSKDVWTIPRTSVISIEHSNQQKNRIPVEVNDLISFQEGEDRDIRCLGVVLRQNAPYAWIRVLSGQQMADTINVWLKKLQLIAKGFSLQMYNEMEEEEMNLSYNSLPACLNLKISEQLINLTELFNPLVTRAKLYSNPLFRPDVMNNDKIKKWGQGVLRKTKVLGTFLSTPTSSPIEPEETVVNDFQEDPSEREKLVVTSSHSDNGKSKNNKNFFSRLFKPKKKSESSQEAGNGSKDVKSSLPTRSTDDLSLSPHSYDDTSLRRRCSDRMNRPVKHADHQLYRSYSDDFHASIHGGGDITIHTSTVGNDESESCMWLNVNSSGSGHSHAAYPMFGNTRRIAGYSRNYVSPPPAQQISPDVDPTSEVMIPEEGEFVSLDSTEGVQLPQAEAVDFDSILQASTPSGFYETRGVHVDPSTLATANLIDLKDMGVITPVESNVSYSLPNSPPSTFMTSDSFNVPSIPSPQEEIPDVVIKPGVVKKSKPLGIGFRAIPSFRKRVVSLPPVPIVTHKGLLEERGKEKQLRFYTNVICHEYQSY